MFEFHARVLEDASNQPNASTAYNLSGTAEAGHRTFASVMTTTNDAVVLAEEVDANGNPSGEFELAECTYTDATPDTLTRDTILDSSNAGSAVDWATAAVTPRLSIIDRPKGMMREVARWEYASLTTLIAFDFVFVSGRTYKLIGEFLHCDGNTLLATLNLRMQRGGQGSVDSGATDYTYQEFGRSQNAWQSSAGDATAIPVLVSAMVGSAQLGFDDADRAHFEMAIHQAGEDEYTRVATLGNAPYSSASTHENGAGVVTGVHKFKEDIDQLEFSWSTGDDFENGRLILMEVFG